MTALAAHVGQWLIGTLVVVGVVVLVSWLLTRRRSSVWREFSRRHGLTFVESSVGPTVTGQLQGRTISVSTDATSSDHDVAGVVVVRMSLRLDKVPRGMTAEGIPGLIGALATLAEDRIHFDSADFDRHVLVRGGDEREVRAYWSNARQQEFLLLVAECCGDQVAIQDQSLAAELRDILSDRNVLEQLLDQLRTAADKLDGGENPGGE